MGSLWKALFNQKYSAEYHQGVYVICLNRWIDCITEQVYIYKKNNGKEHCGRKLHIFFIYFIIKYLGRTQLPLFSYRSNSWPNSFFTPLDMLLKGNQRHRFLALSKTKALKKQSQWKKRILLFIQFLKNGDMA